MNQYQSSDNFQPFDFSKITNPKLTKQLHHWLENRKNFLYQSFNITYHDYITNDTQAIPLVCLHGFPTSSWDWQPILPQLTINFRVITLDFLGYGLSDKPLNYDYQINDQADIVEDLLKFLGIHQYHLLAHDYGDTVAQELLARNHSQKLAIRKNTNTPSILSCCLLNGGLFPETHRPLLAQKLLASSIGKWLSSILPFKVVRNALSKTFHPNFSLPKDEWHILQGFMQYHRGIQAQHKLIDYMQQRRINRQRWVEPLQNPPCPILLINGEDDPISGQHMVQRYSELVQNPKIISIKQCGHYPQLEKPDEIVTALLNFHNELRNLDEHD